MTIKTEPVTRQQVASLIAALGFGAIILDLGKVDYTRGRGVLEGNDRCLWTTDGKRITISLSRDGGMISSQSTEADPELPPATYEAPPPIIVSPVISKCIKPGCENSVDRKKRKSGACCKSHMNYECRHPDCVERAANNGWSRYTHAYGTKIAKQHADYAA